MKNLIIVLMAATLFTACGDDAARRVTTNSNQNNASGNGTDPCDRQGYDCNGNNNNSNGGNTGGGSFGSGFTPASYGEHPNGGLTLSYQASSSTNVTAEGVLELDTKYGFLDCEIPSGRYNINTQSAGQTGDIVHHYKNIDVNVGSNITATLDNVVAYENTQGQWVQDARLNIKRVNGEDCSILNLAFAIPL